MPPWIKICANTNAEDALQAAQLGADAVGFVFAPSKRQVSPQQVRAISDHLPDTLERIGVFPAAHPAEIARAAIDARLHAVQLHGGFDPVVVDALMRSLGPGVSLIHTLHWNVDPAVDSAAQALAQLAAIAAACPVGTRVLVDTQLGADPSGGTGRTFDWHAASATLATQPSLRVILAGGLSPGNVTHAIHTLHPWGVDVASGVELSPGHKDPAKLAAFIKNAREA